MRQACLLLAGALLAGVQAQTSSTAPAPSSAQTIIVSQPVFQTNITLKPVSPRRSPVADRHVSVTGWAVSWPAQDNVLLDKWTPMTLLALTTALLCGPPPQQA